MQYKTIELFDLIKPKCFVALPVGIDPEEYAQVIAIDNKQQNQVRYVCRLHTGKILCFKEDNLSKSTLVKWKITKPYRFLSLLSNKAVQITLRKYEQGSADEAKEFYEWYKNMINTSGFARNNSKMLPKENKQEDSLKSLCEEYAKTLKRIEELVEIIASNIEVNNK